MRSFSHKPESINDMDSEIIIESPGRIILIGERADYNNGYVIPSAIGKYINL